jgi:hypothetical protein
VNGLAKKRRRPEVAKTHPLRTVTVVILPPRRVGVLRLSDNTKRVELELAPAGQFLGGNFQVANKPSVGETVVRS